MAKKNHQFKTSTDNKKGDIRRFVIAFAAFAIVFGTISFIVILKHNNLSFREIFGEKTVSDTSLSSEISAESTTLKAISGQYKFLLYCSDTNINELYFLQVVDVNLSSKKIRIIPLNPNGKPDGNMSYAEILKKEGGRALADAVGKAESCTINRYIGSNENTFALAINHLNGVEYDVQNRIEHHSDDYTLILTKGKQTIKGETLIKYFRYCKTLGSEGMSTQGNLLSAMLEQYVNDENIEKSSTLIQKVMSKLNSDTDISYVEASQAVPSMQALFADSQFETKIIINDSRIQEN